MTRRSNERLRPTSRRADYPVAEIVLDTRAHAEPSEKCIHISDRPRSTPIRSTANRFSSRQLEAAGHHAAVIR